MRGLAALWVVLHHAKQSTDHFLGPIGEVSIIANGNLGVNFFFILSGFIIAYSASRMLESGKGVMDYALSRATRIYVPYLPIGLGVYCLYIMLPGLSQADRETSFLTSATLLPAYNPPALSVAWTLVHEMIFYVVYALIFISKRVLFGALIIWLFAIIYVDHEKIEIIRPLRYLLSPFNLLFMIGVVVFNLSNLIKSVGLWSWLLMGLGVFVVLFEATQGYPNHLSIAIGFSLIIFAAVSGEISERKAIRPLMILGSASYAIYLVHNPVLSIAVRAVDKVVPGANIWMGFWMIVFASVVSGLMYWKFYETKALTKVRAWLA